MPSFRTICRLVLATIVTYLAWSLFCQPASAGSPVIRVAEVDMTQNPWCINRFLGSYDLETFTRITLAGEASSSWHPEALKAQAVMIRGIGYWHFINAQWDDGDGWPICPGKPDYRPHVLHPNRIYFIPRYGAERGNENNQPNKRATETMPQVLLRSNFTTADVYFNDCLQQLSDRLATEGRNYADILLNNLYRPNGPGVTAGCTALEPCSIDTDRCQYQDLSISSRYSLADEQTSMTNRTSPYGLAGATQTSEVTPMATPRPAQRYWGHSRMDGTITNPFRQAGTYIIGPTHGSMIEYRMQLGGSYSHLYVLAISDRPGPVTVNVYIDGLYKGQLQWAHNDNAVHLAHGQFNVVYGAHNIALEFYPDLYQGAGADNDRNLYLKELGAANTAMIDNLLQTLDGQ